MFQFVKYRKIFYFITIILVVVSLAGIFKFGLRWGIDFTGGSLLELEYQEERPTINLIGEKLDQLGLEKAVIQPVNERGVIIKSKYISDKSYLEIKEKLEELGPISEGSLQFETIGPVIGSELEKKTRVVVILALLAIVFYIAFAFRKISKPISSFGYGLVSLVALSHDVIIPLGIFSFLGKFSGVQITIPVVTALLTVLGYSINNSVVVFDRARENLLGSREYNYEEIINNSLNQTFTRSINTSLTTLFVLFAIFFLGGETLKYFALALILGITLGTYSSIFLVTPLLVSYLGWREKKNLQ
jgi:preprotein translocase subunit SecF